MKPVYHGYVGLTAAALAAAVFAWPHPPGRAAEPEAPTQLPPDTAIAAVIEANDGKTPATGDELWRSLGRIGRFAQLPVPFSAVRLDSGLGHPRVVIAPVVTGINRAELTRPNAEGRLFLAANMGPSVPGGDPRVRSVEFISWNATRRKFDFGVIEDMGGSDVPQLRIVDGGKCFSCHKNRGPILGVRPWSNTSHDDILRFATASGLAMTGSRLPDFGPFALPRLGAGGAPLRDRIDGMALATSEAPEVDFSVRFGADLRTYRDTFRLLAHTHEGRNALVFMLVAIAEPGALDANDRELRRALNATLDRSFSQFASDWTNLRRAAKSSALADLNPAILVISSGIRRDAVRDPGGWSLSAASSRPVPNVVKVPGLTGGNGSTWIARTPPLPARPPQPLDPVTKALVQRATDTKHGVDSYTSTLVELAEYELARSAGRHGLTSRAQPSNPRAFLRLPIPTPSRLSDVVTPVLLAGTIGLTDGDRRFLAQALDDGAKRVLSSKVTPAVLAKQVFEGPQFASVLRGGPLPDRDEFKDRFVAGLDDLLKTHYGLPDGFAPDRHRYASMPRHDPNAAEEKEVAVVPTTACLRCHEIGDPGKAPRFDPIPMLAFDPLDKPGRDAWLRAANAKQKKEVLARLVTRLGKDADMPPEDSPEHDLVRAKEAAAFAEAKHFLTTELNRVKGN